MNNKIIWSSNAESTYDKTIKSLVLAWDDKVIKSFIKELNSLLVSLSNFGKLCPKSKLKSLRKCVVSKQTSLVYKIKNNSIYLIAFVPNKTNHNY